MTAMKKKICSLVFVLVLACSFAVCSVQAAYQLQDTFSGTTFFDNFNFNTDPDLVENSYVHYVNRPTAQAGGLISATSSSVYVGVDYTNEVPAGVSGRTSVRLESTKQYNSGLFIVDVTHIPVGCGTFPAVWLLGPNWPAGGEIDIIENVGYSNVNQVTLHTSPGCTMVNQPANSFTGVRASGLNNVGQATNCYVYAPNQYNNSGCGIIGANGGFGPAFNGGGGGVYATEFGNGWPIKVWFFPRNNIPADIVSGSPIPSNWGTPVAAFNMGSDCSPSHFYDMRLVINVNFCGNWAIDRFAPQGCDTTCQNVVQYAPGAYSDAYWRFNSIKVYQYQF